MQKSKQPCQESNSSDDPTHFKNKLATRVDW